MINLSKNLPWKVEAVCQKNKKLFELETSSDGKGRVVRIDGKKVSQNYLSSNLKILWYLPPMDRIWMETPKDRRKFLDRMVFSLDTNHAKRCAKYEKLLRDRISKRDWGERDNISIKYDLADIVMANFQENLDGTITPRFKRSSHLKVIEAFWDHLPSVLFSSIACPVLNLPARINEEKNPRQKLRQSLIDQAKAKISKFDTVWLEKSIHDVPIQKPMLVAQTISQYIDRGFFN